jgi:hypothetical protein
MDDVGAHAAPQGRVVAIEEWLGERRPRITGLLVCHAVILTAATRETCRLVDA